MWNYAGRRVTFAELLPYRSLVTHFRGLTTDQFNALRVWYGQTKGPPRDLEKTVGEMLAENPPGNLFAILPADNNRLYHVIDVDKDTQNGRLILTVSDNPEPTA